MMCPSCYATNEDGVKYCRNCGRKMLSEKERQVVQTDELTRLVGHEHHCSVCGDEKKLFWVKEQSGHQGILCDDCIRIQKMMYGSVYVSVVPYHPGSGRQV